MADMRIGRKSVGLALAVLVLGALTMPAAQGAVSAGASVACNPGGHCVEGGATAVNAGVSSSEPLKDFGAAVAVCHGLASGSSLMEITCSHGRVSETMSFPGTAGAVPLQTTQARLERLPVCWNVTAYFPTLSGLPDVVDTSGCSLLSI